MSSVMLTTFVPNPFMYCGYSRASAPAMARISAVADRSVAPGASLATTYQLWLRRSLGSTWPSVTGRQMSTPAAGNSNVDGITPTTV
jgi:hypothetical protein